MPGPAARLGDTTAHGGTVVAGMPTVLIGGMPAARIGDMHVCPMATPGTPPIPHVGMPIASPGAPTVLIGGMPAATIGSIAPCAGPPDSIIVGCPTVILGAGGAGSASGGGGGGGGGAAANASAATALFDNNESVTKEEHWIEIEFVDKAGLPVSGIPYRLTDPDGNESEGELRLDGTIRRDALESEGEATVVLLNVFDAEWSREQTDVGDVVTMSARAEGFEDGTDALFQVFKRDIHGPDVVVAEVEAKVSGEKVEANWDYNGPEYRDVTVPPEGEETSQDPAEPYSGPDFYFDVIVGPCTATSGALLQMDIIEIEVLDENDEPLAGEEYILYAANGEVRKGTLDGSGKATEKDLPPGYNKLKLPGLPDLEVEV